MGRNARAALLASGVALLALGCDEEDEGPAPADGGVSLSDAAARDDGGRDDGGHPLDASPHGDGSAPIGPVNDKPFAIRGRVGSVPGEKRLKQAGDAGALPSITHVMAVNPATSTPVRYLQPVAADGSFAIGVDLAKPWVIVLVDSSKVGREMIAGVFRGADFDLDSLAATRPGMVDLGTVDIDEATGAASASVSTGNLLTALGLSEAAATLLGTLDDISLRYVNPDIDGNGTIDELEGRRYPLDFHLRYTMRTDVQDIALTDVLNTFADPATTDARYGLGSAIVSWDPARFGATTVADYRIRFPNFAGSYAAAPMPLDTSFAANEWISGADALYLSAGSSSVGISFDTVRPFPTGDYVFQIKETALTFTNVRTHTLEELNRSDGLIIPFLKVETSEPTCTGWSCRVTGIGYRWMKRAESGWVNATTEEIALVVPQAGGFISFVIGTDSSKRAEYEIPGSPASGTLLLTATSHPPQNVSPAELANLTVGQLCQFGVSYDDNLGMRIFQGWRTGPSCMF